jgi:hypothetical protein
MSARASRCTPPEIAMDRRSSLATQGGLTFVSSLG